MADAWANWVGELRSWHLFGGLTFDPRRRVPRPPGSQRFGEKTRESPRLTEDGRVRLGDAPMSADVARGRVRSFLRDGEDVLHRRLAAVVALEYQKNGWPHFHPLLSVEGGLEGGEIAALGNLWFQRCGGNRLEVPASSSDVCAYAAKYLSKGLDRGDVLFWPEKGPIKFPDRGRLVLSATETIGQGLRPRRGQ